MAHGLIEFLSSQDRRARDLRDSFIFYVVPMLNPDGVAAGNSTCNMQGHDPARCHAQLAASASLKHPWLLFPLAHIILNKSTWAPARHVNFQTLDPRAHFSLGLPRAQIRRN